MIEENIETGDYTHRPTGITFTGILDIYDKATAAYADQDHQYIVKLEYAQADFEAYMALKSMSEDADLYFDA